MADRSRSLILAALAAVLVIGGGLWWFLGGDEPEEASIDQAVKAAQGGSSATGTSGTSGGTGATGGSDENGGVTGTWVVTPGDGTERGSFIGFRVAEELATIGATEAVGRTGQVAGEITLDGPRLTAARIEGDLRGLRTDDSRRDGKVQQALETQQFPTATFELGSPVDLGGDPAAGAKIVARGTLTIHGVAREVEVPLDAQLVDGRIAVAGTLPIKLSDFGVEAPSAPIVVSVSDEAKVELQLVLERG